MKKNKYPALEIYLISRWFYKHHLIIMAKIFYRINNFVFQCSIPYETNIHSSVRLCHPRGVTMHKDVEIGENTIIYHNTTFGDKYIDNEVHIKIGKNCLIGANACILGNVTIGDNVKIGANTVVTKDIPSNSTVIGTKTTIIKNNGK